MCFILNGWPGGQQEGQGAKAGPVRGSGSMGGQRGRRDLKQGAVPDPGEKRRLNTEVTEGKGSRFIELQQSGGDGGRRSSRLWRGCRRACLHRNSEDCGCGIEFLFHEESAEREGQRGNRASAGERAGG